jgi:uncharacterized protein (TIGR03000 family)
MFKRWFFVVSIVALAVLMTSAGASRAQAPYAPVAPWAGPAEWSYYNRQLGANYISPAYTNTYGYIYPSTYNMWVYPSYATYGMDRRPYFGSLAPSAYGVPSSVASMPITYIAYYPPVFTDRAPVAAPASGLTRTDESANVEVTVPDGAELWFDGKKTAQTGTHRLFTTPVLEKGNSYHYEVRARWMRDGQRIEETQRVPVSAGARVSVVFPTPKSR